MLAKVCSHSSGRRRTRKNTKLKSHRVYKNWTWDGKERGKPLVTKNKLAKYNADLIATYYQNPCTGTQTVHGLGFDIDRSRTTQQWLDEEGRVSWSKIGSFLAENESPILDFITQVCWSTSGMGLGIYMPIAPLEVVPSTAKAQQSARVLQAHIIIILRYYGIGADPGAMGLCRDIPNFFNPTKLVDSDLTGIDQLVDNKRYAVVSELLRYTNKHPAIRRLKKSDPQRLFTGHRTSERKLARLYEHLLDEALESSLWLSSSEIREITKLSKSTHHAFLKADLPWVEIIDHGKFEGYELVFKPTLAYSERANDLLNGFDLDSETKGFTPQFEELEAPEFVLDGDRNEYLTKATVELKHKAIQYQEALEIMRRIAARIPGHQTSKNCRNVDSIVESIYHHRLELFGVKAGHSLSPVLSLELRKSVAVYPHVPIENPKKDKKGNTFGILHTSLQVSEVGEEARGEQEPEENEEKNDLIKQGGVGDLPPPNKSLHVEENVSSVEGLEEVSSTEAGRRDNVLIDFIAGFAPNAAKALLGEKTGRDAAKMQGGTDPSSFSDNTGSSVFGTVLPFPRASESSVAQTSEEHLVKSLPSSLKLSEVRKDEFDLVDPLDRFEAVYNRCLARKTDKEMFEVLVSFHRKKVRGMIKRADCLKKGDPYRRLVRAFLVMHEELRLKILRILQEKVSHGG